MYTVANPRVQFYANECNEGETLTPNPNDLAVMSYDIDFFIMT